MGAPTMTTHALPYAANCSLLFTELPLLQRPAAARAAGFDTIELWWPWPDRPVPADPEVDALVRAVEDAGVHLAGLNFFGGDLAGPDCGVLSVPARRNEFRDNVDVTLGIAERLGTRVANALYGNRVEASTPQEQDELALEQLVRAAHAAERVGVTVLVEPVSGPKPYPLRTAADALAVVDRVRAAGASGVGFLCDVYHLAVNGDDVEAVVARYADRVAHVQVADAPGRGEPGSGDLPLARWLSALEAGAYDGLVALEYTPTTTTEKSLRWLPVDRRGRERA